MHPDEYYSYPGALPGLVSGSTKPLTHWELARAVANRVPVEPDNDIPQVSNCTWSGNDVDTIEWAKTDASFPIVFRYKGTSHAIAADTATDDFVYWDSANPTVFSKTSDFAVVVTAIHNGGWCMAFNTDGVPSSAVPMPLLHGGLIQAGTITANFGQIGALAVGNAELQDLAVGSRNLVISNFQNLISNPGFEAGDVEWSKSADCTISDSYGGGRTGAWMARATGVGSRVFTSNKFYVVPGEKYHFSAWMIFSGDFAATGASGVEIYWYTAADVYVANSGTNITPSTSWQEVSGVGTVPATAAYGQLRIRTYSMTAGYMYCDDAYVSKQRGTNDIEAGAITPESSILAALSVGTPELALKAVDTPQLADFAATSAKIGLLAVEYGNIKNLAVDTLKLANQSTTELETTYTAGMTGWLSKYGTMTNIAEADADQSGGIVQLFGGARITNSNGTSRTVVLELAAHCNNPSFTVYFDPEEFTVAGSGVIYKTIRTFAIMDLWNAGGYTDFTWILYASCKEDATSLKADLRRIYVLQWKGK